MERCKVCGEEIPKGSENHVLGFVLCGKCARRRERETDVSVAPHVSAASLLQLWLMQAESEARLHEDTATVLRTMLGLPQEVDDLLLAAKCGLADLEGCADDLITIDPESDDPIMQTIRELRAAIAKRS